MAEVRHHLGPHVLDEEGDGGQDEHRGQDAQLKKCKVVVSLAKAFMILANLREIFQPRLVAPNWAEA